MLADPMQRHVDCGGDLVRLTVLIVDDDARNCELLGRLLEMDGCRVVQAMNAADGIALARDDPPDLVLLDVRMPGVDGFAACSRMRADPVLAQLPIYLATAFDDNDIWPHATAAGASGLLAKPYDRAALRRLVESLAPQARHSQHDAREA